LSSNPVWQFPLYIRRKSRRTDMCLAIPGKLISIETNAQPLMGTVSFGGVNKQICLELLPEVTVGEYVLVHVGFAISKMDEDEANTTLELIRDMEAAANEAGQDEPQEISPL
jgi:hydrogenase expression/formation protein HypC